MSGLPERLHAGATVPLAATAPLTVHGEGGGPPRRPRIASARIAVAMLIATEAMFFAGLAGSFLLLRGASGVWPPPGQPRLPIAATVANSVVLLASAWTLHLAVAAIRRGDAPGLFRGLGVTAVLGGIFVTVQGLEWARLVAHGLTLQSGVYGGTFYVIVGCHGLHVVAAVAWLALVLGRARRGGYGAGDHLGVELAAMYWYFVCALWVVLFPLVYLV